MKWFQRKTISIPLVVIGLLVALRIALGPLLLGEINKRLSHLSPDLQGHVDGLNIAIIRGAFGIEDLTMRIKKDKNDFLHVKVAEFSIAWREVLKGRFMVDALIDGVDFRFDERLPKAFAKMIPSDTPAEPKKESPPVRISRVDWKNVNIVYPTNKAYTNDGPFRLSRIEGRITNLLADTETPRSFFHTRGVGSGSSNFKVIGSANLLADPVEWDLDAQMQGFQLKEMNRFLYRNVPLTFTKGNFDLYAEVKSEEGKIRGYVKPFIEDLDFIKRKENFKGPKHWLIEVAGAVGNWVLEAKRDKTVATKVPFSYDGKKFSVDTSKALSKVIEHGFDQELSPGVDGNLKMQAQEAKKEAEETKRENE